jgi:hypothetical protein
MRHLLHSGDNPVGACAIVFLCVCDSVAVTERDKSIEGMVVMYRLGTVAHGAILAVMMTQGDIVVPMNSGFETASFRS